MIRSVLKRSATAFLCTLGILMVFGFVIDQLEAITHTYLMSVFGWGAIVFTGLIGTPIHEIGHWLGCKLFGFKVMEVSLFRPLASRNDGILGYVSYSYDRSSLWHQLGCFITGIAPLLFGGVVIILVLRFLMPEVYQRISNRVESASKNSGIKKGFSVFWAAFSGFWIGLFSLRKWGILRGIICLYIVLSVSMHMSLSRQDLVGASTGFLVVLGIYLIYGLISSALNTDYKKNCIRTASILSSFLSIGLFFCLVMLAIAMLIVRL